MNPESADAGSAEALQVVPSRRTPEARFSLSRKLMLSVGVTLAALIGVLLVLEARFWRDTLREQIDAHLSAVATSRRDMVQAQVTLLRQRVALNTDRGEFRGLLYQLAKNLPDGENRASSQGTLDRMRDDTIVVASLADINGRIVLSTEPGELGRDLSQTHAFREGRLTSFVGTPEPAGGSFHATLAAPIYTRSDSKLVGVLFARADLSALHAALSDLTGLGATGEAILGRREGKHIRFLFPPRNSPGTMLVPENESPAMRAAIDSGEGLIRTQDYRGHRVLAAAAPVGYGGWALLVKMDESEAYGPIARATRIGLLAGGAVAVAGLIAAWWLALQFSRPLHRLARAAVKVASGDYDSLVPVETTDEIGLLSSTFNEMTVAIRSKRDERDRAERLLRESDNRLRLAAQVAGFGMFDAEVASDEIFWSPELKAIYGVPPETRITKASLNQFFLERDHDRIGAAIAEAHDPQGPGGFEIEHQILRADGGVRWVHVRGRTLFEGEGAARRAVRIVGAVLDITQRKRAEAVLREADQRKDEFLAMLGHELRNPLSAIASAVQMWKEDAAQPQAAEWACGVIDRQTSTLARLVDDLLDIARITAGKIELRRQPVDVSSVISRAIESARPLIEQKRHELDVAIGGGGRMRVDADRMRLEQVFTNLLVNAAKYTPDGGRITIETRHDGATAIVLVRDNGIGIAPEVLPEIFELFTQADRSLERANGGLGIGLNLCRHLITLHGGTISARSGGPGAGSEFIVRLPAIEEPAAAESATPAPQLAEPCRSRRVLVVDDNADTVRLLARLLTRRGHQVLTALDGISALKAADDFKPETFILDIGLPGLDGYSLARRLRADGFSTAQMIAISGYAQENDRVRAREAGFDHHFAKPVDIDALSSLLAADS